MGTRKLYDWVHDNPAIGMRSSDFTNDLGVIARNERLVRADPEMSIVSAARAASLSSRSTMEAL